MNIPTSYQEDVSEALKILKSEGCSEIYVFGSLSNGTCTDHSDIDIAIKGCPKGKFFRIFSKLISRLKHSIDLIDLDKNVKFEKLLISINQLKRLDV
ncbi:nucleotidyltransferase domain-containing protein [bacterium]|nr:nucleotidyltransferase domain-containing protein [bacterium]